MPQLSHIYKHRASKSFGLVFLLFPLIYFFLNFDYILTDFESDPNIRPRTKWCETKYASTFELCRKGTASKKELRFAYVQYATQPQYLCNALISFTLLRSFETEAELGLIYPIEWDLLELPLNTSIESLDDDSTKEDSPGTPKLKHRPFIKPVASQSSIPFLLAKAKLLGVNLHPTELLSKSAQDKTWAESFTKLKVLKLTQYDRIIYFDSDGMVQKHMDHLFFSPLAPIALPRAYWLKGDAVVKNIKKRDILTSHFMLVMPSQALYDRMIILLNKSEPQMFDMELMNQLAGETALILPHQSYAMLSGEYRKKEHMKYLNDGLNSEWDADLEAEAAYYVHFSDWPLAKPWITDIKTFALLTPRCVNSKLYCAEREHWLKLYRDFEMMDIEVCTVT